MKERRKRRFTRVTIARRILMFSLIYFILFVANFSLISFSKFSSENSGNASIDVAKWKVSVDTTGSSDTLNIIAGDTPQSYTIKVKNKSEVAAKYTIVLSGLPDGIQVSLDGKNYKEPVNHEITYTDIGSFGINEQNVENEHTLTFRAPLDSDILGSSELNIDVNFSQII